VVAVYVWKHAGVFAIVDDLAVGIERLVDAQDEIEDQLRAYLTAQGSAAGVTTTFLVRYGDPARTLRQLAGDLHADAVVVGSYTSALHKVSGSTLAGRLLRARQWPVIVVP